SARAADSGHDPIARLPALGSLSRFDHLAAHLVAHRHGQRDARVPAGKEFDVGAASQRGAPSHHDLAGSGRRRREVALLVAADRGRDEGPHDDRAPMKRASSGSAPPRRGRPSAASTAASMFSRRSARERSTPQTTGNVALPAAASLFEAFPSVAASDSTSRRSSLIWNARPIRRPYASRRASIVSSAPARIAPAASEARMRRPVLFS